MKNQLVRKILGPTFLAVTLLAGGAVGAQAQSGSSNQNLASQVRQLVNTNEKNNRDMARTMNLLTQIQSEFQSIRGQVDASKFLTQESDQVYRDLSLRVSSLEEKVDQIHRLMKELVDSQKGGEAPKAANAAEYQTYQGLLELVNARDYRSAISGFMGFLRKYPQSPYAGNAQYWIGEGYFSIGDYAKSIKSFQKLVTTYPDNARAKEAIYKQGMGFLRLKKNEEAKLFFQKVMASYPNSSEAAKAQTRLHQLEEQEKKRLALSDSSGLPGKPLEGDGSGKTIYKPRMKPVPMPGAGGTPSQPEATRSPQPSVPEAGGRTSSGRDSSGAPLF